MEVLFLMVRIALGGFFVYEGTRSLSPYGRPAAIAGGRLLKGASPFIAVVSGLMMLISGVAILMGVAAVLALWGLIASLMLVSIVERSRVGQNLAWIAVALLLLLVPRPWPLTLVQ